MLTKEKKNDINLKFDSKNEQNLIHKGIAHFLIVVY